MKNLKKKKNKNLFGNNRHLGFTLVEMLIVVVIIGILAAALIPRLLGAQSQARDVARKKDLSDINSALMMFYNDNGTFPNGDCTYDLDGSWQKIPTAWGNWDINLGHTELDHGNLVSGGYISDIPRDPQKNKTHPLNHMDPTRNGLCVSGAFMFRTLQKYAPDQPASEKRETIGFVLAANMENYKNLNYVLPELKPLSKPYDNITQAYFDFVGSGIIQTIQNNKCDQVKKGPSGQCQTENINSGVYLFLGSPNAQ